MVFLIQSAALFLILYRWPVLGSAGDAGRLAVATASSVLGSATLTLLADVACAPARVHNKTMICLRNQNNVLAQVFDGERKVRIIANLHKEYYRVMNAWVDRARIVLNEHFSVADAYRFENSQYMSMHYGLPKDVDSEWQKETYDRRCAYSGHIDALKQLIEFPSSNFLAEFSLIERTLKEGKELARLH